MEPAAARAISAMAPSVIRTVPAKHSCRVTMRALVNTISLLMPPSPRGSRSGSPSARPPGSCTVARIAVPCVRASSISSSTIVRTLRVQRGGGLVQEEDRILRHEDPRHVHSLLLAARESHQRQRPQPLRDTQPLEHRARSAPRLLPRPSPPRAAAPPPPPPPAPAASPAGTGSRTPPSDDASPGSLAARRTPCPPSRRHDARGSRLPAACSSRTPSGAGYSYPRPTDRQARRTPLSPTARLTPWSTGSRAPPCTCSTKVFSTPRIVKGGSRVEHR